MRHTLASFRLKQTKKKICSTKLLQGLKGDGSAPAPELAIVQPHVAYIVQFITVVAQVLDQRKIN